VSVKTFSDAVNYLEGLKWDTTIKKFWNILILLLY
jgi:hypothetical protein